MRRAAIALSALFWFAAGVTPALAYIDPGAGSLLQQGLAALLASGAVAMISLRHRFERLIERLKGRAQDAAPSKD